MTYTVAIFPAMLNGTRPTIICLHSILWEIVFVDIIIIIIIFGYSFGSVSVAENKIIFVIFACICTLINRTKLSIGY